VESLPEAQIYQVLDYIEFLESKYAKDLAQEASGLQKFAENLEDRLRKRAVNPANIREAFQLIAAADRVLSSVAQAGKELLEELGPGESLDGGGQSAPAREVERPTESAPPPVGGGRTPRSASSDADQAVDAAGPTSTTGGAGSGQGNGGSNQG
jgi:hypothetical protein